MTRTCPRRAVTTRDVKKDPQQDTGEWWTGNTVKPHIPRRVTHRTSTLHRLSQRSGSSGPTPGSVAWGSCTGRQPPGNLALKASGASFQESKRTGAIEFTPKGCAQHLTDTRVQDRGSHSTGAGVSLAAALGASAGELGGHCGSQWSTETGQPFLGAPSTTWHWCWWRQRGILPIAPRCQDLAPRWGTSGQASPTPQ